MNFIPKQAYAYWPTDEHAILERKEFVERLVFHRQNLKEWEMSALNQLNKLINDDVVHEKLDKLEKLRFLYGTGWNMNLTVKVMQDYLRWKQGWPSYKLVYFSISHILDSGGAYIHGRDHRYRPIIVITPKKLIQYENSLLMATSFFILEYIKDNMLLPGQVENWVLIIDLQGFDLNDSWYPIINDLLLYYPCRLAQAFIFNSSKLMTNLFKLLTPNTIQKITIVQNNTVILNTCNPLQVEKRFGGSSNDVKSFWPPIFPCSIYRARGDPPQGLVSEYSSYDEYFPGNFKLNSDMSSLKASGFEDKESFMSITEFKDDVWQKLDVITGSFSFLHTELVKIPEIERYTKNSARGKSDDLTRNSSIPAKKMSIEHELIKSSCCLEDSCLIQ